MKKSRLYRLGLIVIAAAVMLVCGCQKKQASIPGRAGDDAVPVKVVTVKAQDVEEYLDYVANVKAQEETLVYPRVTGKIIEKVKQEGDAVEKGQAIAFIDRDEIGLTFEKAAVESPISGIVGRVLVDIGTNVSPQSAVALVVNMDRVKVFLDVPEKYLPSLSLNMPAAVRVEAYPDEMFRGVITRISPIVDTATRTCQIEIAIDNREHKLRSGMYAKVKIVIRTYKDALVVLKEAIMGKEPQRYVFVVIDQKAAVREIQTGARQGPYVQVTQGLAAGDRVVIMGQQRLREGVSVIVEENGQN